MTYNFADIFVKYYFQIRPWHWEWDNNNIISFAATRVSIFRVCSYYRTEHLSAKSRIYCWLISSVLVRSVCFFTFERNSLGILLARAVFIWIFSVSFGCFRRHDACTTSNNKKETETAENSGVESASKWTDVQSAHKPQERRGKKMQKTSSGDTCWLEIKSINWVEPRTNKKQKTMHECVSVAKRPKTQQEINTK